MDDLQMPYQPDLRSYDNPVAINSIYTYPVAVGDFRILELNDVDDLGVLQCSIKLEKLRDVSLLGYTAISYTWNEHERLWYGDYDVRPKPILIDGVKVLVTDKVANILSLMQQRGRRRVWIDAICINQQDGEDKNGQVSQMGLIYSTAKEVVSVIGSPTEKTDAGLDPENWFASGLDSDRKYQAYDGVNDIVRRNGYWKRAWVLQEIALARQAFLSCGSQFLQFSSFQEICGRIKKMSNSKEAFGLVRAGWRAHGFSGFLRNYHEYSDDVKAGESSEPYDIGQEKSFVGRSFLTILHESRRYRGCSNPSDILYSKLALASDADTLVGAPDYALDTTLLYRMFAAKCINTIKSLEVITYAQNTEMNLPTWVPDWSSARGDWNSDYFHRGGSHFEKQVHRAAMSCISWGSTDLPQVPAGDDADLVVLGRVLAVVPEGFVKFRRLKQAAFDSLPVADEYAEVETPTAGDLVCTLQGCHLFVYLHSVGDKFKIVGRNPRWQDRIFEELVYELVWQYETAQENSEGTVGKTKKWAFKSADDINAVEQQLFRII